MGTARGGQRTGFAATAWNSLCADPPMLLACVSRSASAYELVNRTRAFSVNLLPTSAVETVAIFSAQRGLERADRFLPGNWLDGPMGQPLLRDAIASFECSLEATHDHGTHTILIGRVCNSLAGNDEAALVYLDGGFASAVRVRPN